ncbi:MAG: fibronectin type III domain-containing protein [Pirellulales bacterium]|nr:fibronectin type III domain-containing protein [Pirellulales bacterium]
MSMWLAQVKRALVQGALRIRGKQQRAASRRSLRFEPLEPRIALAAAGLVAVGSQPTGGLSGKIAYIHAGHGYTADNLGDGDWSFQRSEAVIGGTPSEMIEDLGNVDQMTYLADYLFRAGATVVPLRPIGHQTNEVVLDNDDPGVTFSGSWTNSSASTFFGSAGDVPYKYASTSVTETAYARYRPNFSEAGFYPVYAWTRAGSDRATDQLYRVNHAGGITEVNVNHRMVGNGLVYLGSYYFEAGTNGYVDISNRSNSAGSVVIADMIRFGNGMGDIDRGGGVSTLPREDEAGLYWVQWHVDHSQGIPSSEYRGTTDDRDATVSLSPRYAEYMNREATGSLSDRVFVSYHSNASGGRGVVGLYNGNNNPATATPNQFVLAKALGQEVNDDLVEQNGQFEHDWYDRGTSVTLDRSDIEFGEINNSYINDEFDATIVEVAFHDDLLDAQLMRDPKVRDAVARATYQGLISYFRAVDGNVTPATALPTAVSSVQGKSNLAGSVTLSWIPPTSNAYLGDAATGYRIYASENGYAFDGGTYVAGGATTTTTLSGYDPNAIYYFKIVAVNAGGESPGSEVLAIKPSGGAKQVLIVNGFDRLDRSLNERQTLPSPDNTIDRVRLRGSNTHDYTVQVAAAIQAASPNLHVATTSNEAVISGAVNLADYSSVIWILGEESSADDTFNATEQTKVSQYVTAGGNLFVTGAEIAWDLDYLNNGRSFYENTLKGNYVSDDANTYAVNGSAGTIFAGLSFSFDNGTLFYDAEYADVINPQSGAQTVLTYAGGAGGAGILAPGTGGRGHVVLFGFPFETITTSENRTAVMDRVLDYFYPNADFNASGLVDSADYAMWRKYNGTTVPRMTKGDANGDGLVNSTDYNIWRSQFGTAPIAAAGASEGSELAFGQALASSSGEDVLATPAIESAATPSAEPAFQLEVLDEDVAIAAETTPVESGSALAAGLVATGSQPTGPLTGKIVFVSPGHGYQHASGSWRAGRGETNDMVEDFGNYDQATYYVDYLFRAGATVVPMRPVGRQVNEVVLDNDLPEVTYTGSWSNSVGSRWYDEDYGAVADAVHYRFANASATETATATYTPNITAAGFYPVYAWASAGSNRTSQVYKVNHTGGQTQVRVDHSQVGGGWVYLGTYHFDAGSSATAGSVTISNEGTAGKVVIADAIRFGNGMGDVLDGPNGAGEPGGTISGKPREDEASLMWVIRSIGQGIDTTAFFDTDAASGDPNVSAPARMAEQMYQDTNTFGTGLYIAIHSNAFDGTARGAVGLISNSGSSFVPTPNQSDLALFLGRQVNQDMQAINGTFEYDWSTRTTHTYTSSFGEINNDDFTNDVSVVEMDASLTEVAFHDNVQDAAIMCDPKGREQLARSTYQATLEYFDNYGGLISPASVPTAPANVWVESNAAGQVTIHWAAGPSNPSSVFGSAATGFRIYASTDGYGFDGGTLVAGGAATSATLTGYDPNMPYYFRVVAVNSGGESSPSEVVTALPSGGFKQVLIVSGFDRFDRTQDFQYTTPLTLPSGANVTVDRVYARYNNSFDYVVQVQSAIQAAKPGVHVATASNEAVISGAVNLNNYDSIIWILGNESTANSTFNATEQTLVTNFINAGGNLFLSGSEIGWDLDQQNNGRTFYENVLKGNYVADDAGTYTAVAAGGGIFAGMSNLVFSNGASFSSLDSQTYDVASPDVIAPQPGAISALSYSGGSGGNAAIQVSGTGGAGNLVMFGFPFETLTNAAIRETAMDRILDFFGVAVENADFNSDGNVDASDFVIWRKNNGLPTGATRNQGDANGDGAVNAADYNIWRAQFGTSPGAGSGAALGDNSAVAAGGEPLASTAALASGSETLGPHTAVDTERIAYDQYFADLGATVTKNSHPRPARRVLLANSPGPAAANAEFLLAAAVRPDRPSATPPLESTPERQESVSDRAALDSADEQTLSTPQSVRRFAQSTPRNRSYS